MGFIASALDPAFPWYGWQEDQSVHVGKQDAAFVDVIHTNSARIYQVSANNDSGRTHTQFPGKRDEDSSPR